MESLERLKVENSKPKHRSDLRQGPESDDLRVFYGQYLASYLYVKRSKATGQLMLGQIEIGGYMENSWSTLSGHISQKFLVI